MTVKQVSPTRWVVELVEDEVTHELLLTIPPDALAQAGWDFGDTLEWKIDPMNHQVTLKKKE